MLKAHALHAANRDIAEALAPVEQSIEQALKLQIEFMARALAAREESGVAISIGHEALARIAAATTATVTARGEFIEAHKALVGVRDDLRLPAVANGSPDGCPGDGPVKGLLVVEAKAA